MSANTPNMSEPLKLSKVLGLKKSTSPDPRLTLVNDYLAIQERNRIIDEIDQLSPDVEKLEELITDIKQHELYDLNLGSKYLAKQIINNMNEWITKSP